MSWESREGGGRYYTRTRRINGRQVREYVGCGRTAILAAALDKAERRKREERAAAQRDEREQLNALEAQVAATSELAELAANACLLAAGFHYHRGEWRRRRVRCSD